MKRNITLIIVLLGALIFAGFFVAIFGVQAKPPIPESPALSVSEPHAYAEVDKAAILKTLEEDVNVLALAKSRDDPNVPVNPTEIDNINLTTAFDGYPGPGEVITLTYYFHPHSTDGEGVDAFLFVGPKGWMIEGISPPPGVDNTGCGGSVTSEYNNSGSRPIAYWGNAFTKPSDLSTPPGDIPRSACGPWKADGSTTLTFIVTLRIPTDAATCPGASQRVGYPWDGPQNFTYLPILDESVPAWLYGDGGGSSLIPTTTWKIARQLSCPEPNIRLQKTVGNVGSCPASNADFMEVPQGNQVEYCYKLYNDSPEVTVTYHTIVDDQNGTLAFNQDLPPLSWASAKYVTTITGTIGIYITNTATWYATTTLGFGQKPQQVYTAPFQITEYYGQATDIASVKIAPPEQKLFLPLVTKNK